MRQKPCRKSNEAKLNVKYSGKEIKKVIPKKRTNFQCQELCSLQIANFEPTRLFETSVSIGFPLNKIKISKSRTIGVWNYSGLNSFPQINQETGAK